MSLNNYSVLLALCWLVACISLSGMIPGRFEPDEFRSMKTQRAPNTEESMPVEVDYLHLPIKMWTSDFHISTVFDIKYILSKLSNVSVIDKSLSGHCHLTNTCQVDLKVINAINGIYLSPCPNRLRKLFYDVYVHDPEFQSADAYLCTHASSMCELYMPFGKPIVVVASTRYEIGRHSPSRWKTWNENLRLLAAKEGNVVAANNAYDQEYIRYFTGLGSSPRHVSYRPSSGTPNTEPTVSLLPSLCAYVQTTYRPDTRRQEILIAPGRGVNAVISAELLLTAQTRRDRDNARISSNSSTRPLSSPSDVIVSVPPIRHLRDMYPHYEYSDLASHPAMVLLPYQVSFMLFFELYQMAIPLFVPAPQLLAQWHIQHRVLSERSWGLVYGAPTRSSVLPVHPAYATSPNSLKSDPNNEFDVDAVLEWISLADFYQLPHTLIFSSLDDLMDQLSSPSLSERLQQTSRDMMAHNKGRNAAVQRQWGEVVDEVRHRKALRSAPEMSDGRGVTVTATPVRSGLRVGKRRPRGPGQGESFEEALEKQYGVRLLGKVCEGQTIQ